jgi:hypothetical protein
VRALLRGSGGLRFSTEPCHVLLAKSWGTCACCLSKKQPLSGAKLQLATGHEHAHRRAVSRLPRRRRRLLAAARGDSPTVRAAAHQAADAGSTPAPRSAEVTFLNARLLTFLSGDSLCTPLSGWTGRTLLRSSRAGRRDEPRGSSSHRRPCTIARTATSAALPPSPPFLRSGEKVA